MKPIILCLFVILFTSWSYAKPLSIMVNGEQQKQVADETIRGLRAVKLNFYNSTSKHEEPYLGARLHSLISAEFPKLLGQIVEVEFISINGYRSYLAWETIKKGDPILSYQRADGEKFVRYSVKEKAIVELGPYYLVWDMSMLQKQERDFFSSIYQIEQINLITSKVNFGIVEGSAEQGIELGFRTYKRYCLSCHALGKIGGEIGPNLLERKIIAEKGSEYVAKYALNPSEMNQKTKMLALPNFKNREQMAQGVVDFLKFISDPRPELNKSAKQAPRMRELTRIINEVKGN